MRSFFFWLYNFLQVIEVTLPFLSNRPLYVCHSLTHCYFHTALTHGTQGINGDSSGVVSERS